MSRFELPFRGPYDLSAAIEFLEGWPPTAADRAAESQLRWATCIEGTWDPIEVTVTQHGPVLTVDYLGTDDRVAVEHHVARVLSVDVDGTGLVGVAARDPVAGVLIEASPGLRPTCFWTPYEAAVWGVISARSSMVQASRVKRRIADALGPTVGRIRAFPSPDRLLDVDSFPGISSVKIERLHAVARAALDGALDASH
ncbi:MAG: DNA-3-methyladenine glycosylase 2 family protein, partial [Acidimicrobiia bacterium]